MSTLPENELDLEKLFLPAWAQEPPSAKHYAQYEGGEEPRGRQGDRRGPRPPRRDGPPRGDRQGPNRGAPGANRGAPPGARRGPRRDGDRPKPFGEPRRSFGGRDPRDSREPRERRELPPPLPELNVNLVPDEKGVESLARQIKTTGRAYPLFDIARLILERPERYSVTFTVKKNPAGAVVQPLVVCLLDETLWLSEVDAIAHVLKVHFATFYQTERTATEPPKGKYTFVSQCGMSGVILGPPNHHDYQNQLRKLHTERFSRMPFEAFKARVKIVRDEEVVKKWIEGQSWKTDFVCLNMPEPLRLATREEVEKHFREVHKENIIKPVESHRLNGAAARGLRSPDLLRLMRFSWENQRRFPLQLATVLSQQFATHGLQFFKVNKTITHVSVARPHFLDLETTPVSEGVKRIVDHINTHPKCTRRKLMEALAPAPAPAPAPATIEVPAGGTEAAPAPTPAPVHAAPTPEQTTVIGDLHWLIHQGHVIEFANGVLDTAKKPLPRPPKPEKKPAEAKAAEPAAEQKPAEVIPSPDSDTSMDAAPVEAELPVAQLENSTAAEPTAEPSDTSTVAEPDVAAEQKP